MVAQCLQCQKCVKSWHILFAEYIEKCCSNIFFNQYFSFSVEQWQRVPNMEPIVKVISIHSHLTIKIIYFIVSSLSWSYRKCAFSKQNIIEGSSHVWKVHTQNKNSIEGSLVKWKLSAVEHIKNFVTTMWLETDQHSWFVTTMWLESDKYYCSKRRSWLICT